MAVMPLTYVYLTTEDLDAHPPLFFGWRVRLLVFLVRACTVSVFSIIAIMTEDLQHWRVMVVDNPPIKLSARPNGFSVCPSIVVDVIYAQKLNECFITTRTMRHTVTVV